MPTPEAIRSQILDLVKEYHTAKFAHKSFDPDKDLVHYAGRLFDAEEIVNLIDAGLDFFLTANRYAERFETEFADYLGLSNALLVNSGSSANLVALTTLTSPKLKDRRLKPGDEVLTVACGFPIDTRLCRCEPWRLYRHSRKTGRSYWTKNKSYYEGSYDGCSIPSRYCHGSRKKT